MDATIRPHATGDRDAVVDVMVLAEMFAQEDAPFLEDALDRHLTAAATESRCLVATRDDQIVAAVLARAEEATDRVRDLTMIGVRPDQQRHGDGRALMRTIEKALTDDDLVVFRRTLTRD